MNPATDLSIVTTVTGPYVRFLAEWVASLAAQTVQPASIIVVGNGLGPQDRALTRGTLEDHGLDSGAFIDESATGCGRARNLAIAHTHTPWTAHLDADDVLLPDALEQVAALADEADVISLGHEHWWPGNSHGYRRRVVYGALDGQQALSAKRIASSCSPFRRSLWEQWHYPEHLDASWDYGLWLGLAHLGARFRPTARPAFRYRQWGGSHWRKVGQHRRDDLLALRRQLEADFAAAQAENLGRTA